MGNNAMREHIRRSNKEKNRPSRQYCCQSCSNRRTPRPGSSSRPVNPSNCIAAVPRTTGERAVSQNRSEGARVSAGARGLSSALPRSKWIHQQPRTSPIPTSSSTTRRRRIRARSRPNNQSGGPVGGDLAVPGDQPTSPQPPEELREQTENTAELVRVDVCRPTTPSPQTSCTTPQGSYSEIYQRAIPARWSFLRKHVQKVRESQSDLNQCSSIDSEPPDGPTPTEVTSKIPYVSRMTRTSKTPATEPDEVVPRLETGFYFGNSVRQSWPHSGASAEYFTAVSNRRMKKLEPLISDDITTTFEVDEEDPIEKRRPDKTQTNDEVADAATNAGAAAAAKIGYSVRDKRSSRNPQSVRKARRSSSTTSRAYRTGRLRWTGCSRTNTIRIRGTVMHDALRKVHAVDHRRNKKRSKKNADCQIRSISNDPVRPNVTPITLIGRVPLPERETCTSKSCSASSGPSNQGKNPHRRQSNHNSVKEDEKHSVIQQDSRKNTHNKHIRGRPHRHQTYQQRRALKVHQRTLSDAPQRYPWSQSLVDKSQKMYSTFIPHRLLRGINRYLNSSARGSESFQEPEYRIDGKSYCTESDTLGTKATPSRSTYEFDVADDGTSKQSPYCIQVGITDPNRAKVDNILENQEDLCKLGLYDFEHRGQIQTVRQDRNICPKFISSKLRSNGTLSAQLFINHVLPKPTGSTECFSNTEATRAPDERTKKIISSNDRISKNTIENTNLQLEVNKNCIPGIPLDSQNIENSDFLIRSLAKPSVGVQKVLFPHLNKAERASKTTQISQNDLVCALRNIAEGNVLEPDRILSSKSTVLVTRKCKDLPLRGTEIPSTSHRKTRKAVRKKYIMNVLAKSRRPPKYKFVKRNITNSGSKVSTAKSSLSPPNNVNGQDVTKVQPTTFLEATPKLHHKKFPARSNKDIDGSMLSACTTRFKQTHRLLRLQQNMEDNSRSELVSLFRAETRGSSIQSVEVNSSNSMYDERPTVFMEHLGKKTKGAVLPPKSHIHAKHPENVNHTGPQSQFKREIIGSPEITKKNEWIRQSTMKRSAGERTKVHTPPSDRVSRAPSPRQQRDTVSNAIPYEQPNSSASTMPNDSVQKTNTPKLPRDSLTGSLNKRMSPTPVSNTAIFRPPNESMSRPLHLEQHEKHGSKTHHSGAISDTGSKTKSPGLSSDLANVQTTRRQSYVKTTKQSFKISSGLEPKMQYAITSPIAPNTVTLSPKSSIDSRHKSRTPKSWSDSTQNGGSPKLSADSKQSRSTSKSLKDSRPDRSTPIFSSDSRQTSHTPQQSKLHTPTSPKRHTPAKILQTLTSSKLHTPTSLKPPTPTSLKPHSHTSMSPKLPSPTSPKTESPSSPKQQSPTLSKPQSPTLSKPQSPTIPKPQSPTSPRPYFIPTPISALNTKKNAYHSKLRGYLESGMRPLRHLHDEKPNEHVVNLMIEPERRSPSQKESKQNNDSLSTKRRKLVKKRRAPSPPLVSKPQEKLCNTSLKDIQILDKDSENNTHLIFYQSLAEKNHCNYPINQNLTLVDKQNNEVSPVWKLPSRQNSFSVPLTEKPMYFDQLPLQEISTSYCSCKFNGGCSFSSTSMIPAVGSYEDKLLSPSTWRKSDDYRYKVHDDGEKISYTGTLESPLSQHALHSLAEPLSDIQQKTRNIPKEYSGNGNNTKNSCEVKSSALSEHLRHYQYVNTHQIDGSNDKEGPKDGDKNNVPTTITIGIRGKSESRSVSSTDRETEPNQLELCCGLVENHGQRRNSRYMTEPCFAKKIQESVSTTGILIPLQSKSGLHSTSHSAVSTGVSVLGGLSSQDATELGQMYTHSDIVSNRNHATHTGSSLTDAVSCISSIPEDSLPNIADSNSTTCHAMPEEFSCDCTEQSTKEPLSPDNYTYWYRDQSRPSASHSAEYSTLTTVLKRNPCDIETTTLKGTQDNERYKRSHGRSPAKMHVTWDVAVMKNGCICTKCSRCGALRTEGTEMCHPVATCWHEPKIQDDQYYVSDNRYLRCGRCVNCLREQHFTKDLWSQSSPPVPSVSCTLHMPYHENNLDHTSPNSEQTATKVLQNNVDVSCKIATVETHSEDLLDIKTGVFRTPTHPFSSCNFPQTARSRNACIPPPTDGESRQVLHPAPNSQTFMTLGYNSSHISHERVDDYKYRSCGHPVKAPRTAVASFRPVMPTLESQCRNHTPTSDKTRELKMKLSNRHHPNLTLSPVHTTSLPEDTVFEGTSRSYNKDIVLQRVADLLETRSSVLSIDSYNMMVSKEVDSCLGTDATKLISKFNHNSGGKQRLSVATSTNEPPDIHLERIVSEIAYCVNNFLRDMTLAIDELQNMN